MNRNELRKWLTFHEPVATLEDKNSQGAGEGEEIRKKKIYETRNTINTPSGNWHTPIS